MHTLSPRKQAFLHVSAVRARLWQQDRGQCTWHGIWRLSRRRHGDRMSGCGSPCPGSAAGGKRISVFCNVKSHLVEKTQIFYRKRICSSEKIRVLYSAHHVFSEVLPQTRGEKRAEFPRCFQTLVVKIAKTNSNSTRDFSKRINFTRVDPFVWSTLVVKIKKRRNPLVLVMPKKNNRG